jgi:hypothetical protein
MFNENSAMMPLVLSVVRWMFSEVLVCAVVLLAMAWLTGLLSQ